MRPFHTLFALLALLLVAIMPIAAQSDPVDIDGDLLLTAFVENIIVFYPEACIV